MKTDTTRRALLGGAGLATAALIAPAVAATRATPAGISPELAALIAATGAAKKAATDYEANVCKAVDAEAERQIAAIPHVTVLIDPEAPTVWTTANLGSLNTARRFVQNDPNHPNIAGFRELLAADDRRAQVKSEIRRATGQIAAMERCDALGNAWADAQGEVAAHPVSTAADLHAKLAFMLACGMAAEDGWFPYLVADAARVAKMEGR